MRKALMMPIAVLTVVFLLSLWNGAIMARHTDRWREQLHSADALAQSAHWSDAEAVLQDSYADWSSHQTWLHIVTEHDAVDDAEAMYHRALAYAAVREITEFRAELADLRDQLRLLADMERLSIRNVL